MMHLTSMQKQLGMMDEVGHLHNACQKYVLGDVFFGCVMFVV